MSTETVDTGEREAVELENKPTVVSGIISLTAGILAMAGSAPFSGLAIPFGLLGLLFLGTGLFVKRSRQWVSLGVTSLFIGVLIVGMLGLAPPSMLLASAVGVLVAWDVGQHAVTIGEQFGRTTPTRRGELFHAAASIVVGVLAAGIGYTIYLLGSEGQPALAMILLLLGAVALVWALRD